MNGSVKHVVFGHGCGYRNFKICSFFVMAGWAICVCGYLNVLEEERVIKMSSQWPYMCFGKLTCCVVSNDARMSVNVVVVADSVSR